MTQAAFLFDALPTSAAAAPALPARRRPPVRDGVDEVGFEIGWDHAHHRLTPPLAHLHADNPVRQGWSAARAVFGQRTLRPTLHVRRWLALRLAAWQHGEAVEGVQVTPHFIAQLDAAACPVTGAALDAEEGQAAAVSRLNRRAAHAAGNLVLLSTAAARAAAGRDWHDALAMADAAEAAGQPIDGLEAAAWRRLGLLASLATPIEHARAAELPLRVLPPNRVRVLNPVQALQVMLTLQFCEAGYARRLVALAALMPSSEIRHAFQVFMHTLLARRLAVGSAPGAAAMRAAMELAWGDALVLRRWQRLATRLTAAQCEQLLERAARRGLMGASQRWQPVEAATEGWGLDSGGRLLPPDQDSAISATDGVVSAKALSH